VEFLKPQLFKDRQLLCGMSMKGDIQTFKPSGFSFRQLQLSDEQFRIHDESMNLHIGSGIGKRIVSLNQVHGTEIVDGDIQSFADGDGLYTSNPEVVLGIALADCCGIMIYDPKKAVIMALHAGWRGVLKGIATKGITILKRQFNSQSSDLLIWLTPCAGKDRYEVGPEFLDYFPGFIAQINGIYCFDLRGYLISELLQNGVIAQHIECSTICTIEDMRFHSYRREGNSGRNIAFIGFL
jgi:YfiH family protein